jgi:hypothetical protein
MSEQRVTFTLPDGYAEFYLDVFGGVRDRESSVLIGRWTTTPVGHTIPCRRFVKKDPTTYDGTPICLCCGDGWPSCSEMDANGKVWTHAETCDLYVWAGKLCDGCDLEMKKSKEEANRA